MFSQKMEQGSFSALQQKKLNWIETAVLCFGETVFFPPSVFGPQAFNLILIISRHDIFSCKQASLAAVMPHGRMYAQL
jgi:hypothetical protein